MRSGPAATHPAPNFIPPSIHCPAVNGFAELKFIWNVGDRSPLTFAALMMGHHVSMVMGEEHLGRLLIAVAFSEQIIYAAAHHHGTCGPDVLVMSLSGSWTQSGRERRQ